MRSCSIVRRTRRHGFTLIELLVVVAIIALLMSILLPALSKAREQARAVACGSNLKQIGTTIFIYAQIYNDFLPASGNTSTGNYYQGSWAGRASYAAWPDQMSLVVDNAKARAFYFFTGKIFLCPSNFKAIRQDSSFNDVIDKSYLVNTYAAGRFATDAGGNVVPDSGWPLKKIASISNPSMTHMVVEHWMIGPNPPWAGPFVLWSQFGDDKPQMAYHGGPYPAHAGARNNLEVDGHVERMISDDNHYYSGW